MKRNRKTEFDLLRAVAVACRCFYYLHGGGREADQAQDAAAPEHTPPAPH